MQQSPVSIRLITDWRALFWKRCTRLLFGERRYAIIFFRCRQLIYSADKNSLSSSIVIIIIDEEYPLHWRLRTTGPARSLSTLQTSRLQRRFQTTPICLPQHSSAEKLNSHWKQWHCDRVPQEIAYQIQCYSSYCRRMDWREHQRRWLFREGQDYEWSQLKSNSAGSSSLHQVPFIWRTHYVHWSSFCLQRAATWYDRLCSRKDRSTLCGYSFSIKSQIVRRSGFDYFTRNDWHCWQQNSDAERWL